MKKVLALLMFLSAALAQAARVVTVHNTTELQAAFTNQQANDTIMLDAGTYGGPAGPTQLLVTQPGVTVTTVPGAQPNAMVLFDTKPGVAGVTFRDLHMDFRGSVQYAGTAIQLHGPSGKAINNWIHCGNAPSGHPSRQGIAAWQQNGGGPGQEVYGNVIIEGHHDIYIQNAGTDGEKVVKHNILIRDFGCDSNCTRYAIHGYTETGWSERVRAQENIVSGAEVMLGGALNGNNYGNVAQGNALYNSSLTMTYGKPARQIAVTGNHIFRGRLNLDAIMAGSNTITGNEIYNPGVSGRNLSIRVTDGTQDSSGWHKVPFASTDLLDINKYLLNGTTVNNSAWLVTPPGSDCCGSWSLTKWVANLRIANCGLCEASTAGVAEPTVPLIYLFPNQYESGRGELAVVDWNKTTPHGVTVSLDGVVPVGGIYTVRRAEDGPYAAPVAQGVYAGPFSLPVVGEFDSFIVRSTLPPTPTPTKTNTPPMICQTATPTPKP